MATLFANNAASTLASGISGSATSLTLSTGEGALFPSPSGGDVFFATLAKQDGSAQEIVQVTARTTDTLTIVRGQEGTSAVAWLAGDQVQLRITAAMLTNFETAFGWGDHAAGGYAAASHTHSISDITNLQTSLDGKAASSHTHVASDITTGTFADARISGSSVTQHQGSLSIAFSQITGTVDADTLDGINHTGFLRSNTSDNIEGDLTISTGSIIVANASASAANFQKIRLGRSTSQYVSFFGDSGGNTVVSVSPAGNPKPNIKLGYSVDDGATVAATYTLTGASGTVWHSGNDGAGTGLAADTVDGVHASQFIRSDTTDSATGALTFSGGLNLSNGPGTIAGATFNNGWLRIGSSSTGWTFDSNEMYTAGACTIGALSGSTLTINGGTAGTINMTSVGLTSCTGNISQWTNDSGYAVGTVTTAATANTIMSRDGNGDTNVRYLFSTYLNMSHSVATRSGDTVFFSSTDNYIRKTNATGMKNALGLGTGDAPTFTGLNVTSYIDLQDNDILRFGTGDDWEFFTNGVHAYMDLNSGIGNFYIRDGTTIRFTFDDAGAFTATGNITAFSDRKLKKNIQTLDTQEALDTVLQMRPVSYDRKDIKRHEVGFIAQEQEDLVPHLVEEDNDIKSLDYGKHAPYLVAAIQRLEARIRELENDATS